MMAVHSFAIRDLVYARHRMRADFGVVPRALRSETFAFYTSCSACRVLCLAASLPLSHPPRPSYHKNDIVSFSFFFLSIRVSIPSSCPLVAIYLPSSSFPGILKFATKDIDTKIAGGEGR